ncbi:hypothetical protein [Mycolicibacterium sp. CR10]|uniref:hypothetical protein n=1 Tax=Mycolicibacterium sp. CR10 TaxID=2562314 RepID=UPI0010BF7F20|nr:hypothetical protein [Mycolicibacterium sp. CR10]
MTDQALTPADTALRERITTLSVHIPCGGIRGPIRRGMSMLWQSCHHEDSPAQWVGADVSRDHDLCIICFRATAGGRSRWSWKACEDCRDVNRVVGTPFALGRHSLMNGIGVEIQAPQGVREQQQRRVAEFGGGDWRLRAWRDHEYRLMAARFEPDADVPLRDWQQAWPPSRSASRDAFAQLLGAAFPLPRRDGAG